MNEEQKIEKIKERIRELININYDRLKEIEEEHGTNNQGYAMYLGAYDDLNLVLKEINSGEIYE